MGGVVPGGRVRVGGRASGDGENVSKEVEDDEKEADGRGVEAKEVGEKDAACGVADKDVVH